MKFFSDILRLLPLALTKQNPQLSSGQVGNSMPQGRLMSTGPSIKTDSDSPCWFNDPQVEYFSITACGSGTAADGVQLSTADSSWTSPIGVGIPETQNAWDQFFLEPTMGYLCLWPSQWGSPMAQLCLETDSSTCLIDPYGLGPWVQVASWFFSPISLLSCAVDENQLLSCKYGGYDYLELGPVESSEGFSWFPLLGNNTGPGSLYLTTNGTCN